ncbi:hypothetical protein [Streptomyces prunicolor]|uniref:hypothetical protein n=1 Tax=Streptomyces prunicolor TaxID=67348 RepID=UPI00342555FA
MLDEESKVGLLNSRPSAEEVLERAVDEVHPVGSRFTKEAAPLEEVFEDDRRITQSSYFGDCGQSPIDDVLRAGTVHLGTAILDQPVSESLEEIDLWLLAEFGARHVPFPVASTEQHGERSFVEVLAAVREIASSVAMEGTDEPAHQRIRGQTAEGWLGSDGSEELPLVLVEIGSVVGIGPCGIVPLSVFSVASPG